jgi:Kef-type K+ transport system membrane component KefB/nucleotide-binding universal stress UspA family protein
VSIVERAIVTQPGPVTLRRPGARADEPCGALAPRRPEAVTVSFQLPGLPLSGTGPLFTVLVAAILLAPILARRLRLPEVVTVLLVGFVVGPTGIGLVERAGVVQVLGNVGLLYLMFVAGLELDLDDFIANRRDSIGFGAATFVVPMALGTVTALVLGYDVLAALLLASCWASHTLVTYPAFQRVGTVANRAVATSVGATIITDTAALLVLAVVVRAHQGALDALFWLTLLPSLALLVVGTLWGLPKLARRFFSGPGQDRSLRFLFVMVVLFTVASLAEVIGIEGIVGAFLAGLALNRSVPNGGLLMERVGFIGATLFIPLFLLATGMLIDLEVLTDPRTLVVGAVFAAVAIVAKLLAAVGAGRMLGYSGPEVGAMFSLSSAQAAATLAAIVVGLQVGLLDELTVNAVMLVIVVTCVVAPAVAARYATRLPRPAPVRDLGDVVVVPIANPESAGRLMRIASAFVHADGGLVVPLMVVPPDTDAEGFTAIRDLDARVLRMAQSAGAEARSVVRIDTTPEAGISHTVVEHHASLLVMGWKGGSTRRDARFGGIIDGVLSRTSVPTLVLLDGNQPFDRLLLIVDESVMNPAGAPALDLAVEAARLLAKASGTSVRVVTNRRERDLDRLVRQRLDVDVDHDVRRRSILVRACATPQDLIVVPAIGDEQSLRAVAGRVALAAPTGASVLVALDSSTVDPGVPTGRLASAAATLAVGAATSEDPTPAAGNLDPGT